MKHTFYLSALCFLVCSCGQGPELDRQAGRSDIIQISDDDPEMDAAMAQARKTFEEQATNDPEALAKVRFSDPGASDEAEHMWVSDLAKDGDLFTGILVSAPGHLKSVAEGQKVSFPLSDVSDWLAVKDGVAQGSYTVKLLRSRMGDQEREEHDSHYPFSFD